MHGVFINFKIIWAKMSAHKSSKVKHSNTFIEGRRGNETDKKKMRDV